MTWEMVDNDAALLFNTKGNKSTLLKIQKLALMIHRFLCIAPIQQALGTLVVCLLNPPNSVFFIQAIKQSSAVFGEQ